MNQFAANTTVSVEKTRAEIDTLITKYGATGFVYGRNDLTRTAMIEFYAHERRIRFMLPLADPAERRFRLTPGKNTKRRTDAQALAAWEQDCRSRWRALLLAIKAKLESVAIGISEFESEFLANIVDPVTGKTVGEVVRPVLLESYAGRPQPLLLGLDQSRENA